MSRCNSAVGISTFSGFIRDIAKFGTDHSTRRTVAMASLKVGSSLTYQAAALGWRAALVSAAHRVMRENRLNRAGVGARDGEIGPLALGLDAEMFAGLLEGGLH